MKKLLILFAFIMLIYYAKAAQPETWQECANRVVYDEHVRSEAQHETFMKDLCDFYGKERNECQAILEASTPNQQAQIFLDYLRFAVVVPKCGTPK